MVIIPGGRGLIYYELTPVGNKSTLDKIAEFLASIAPKPEDVAKFFFGHIVNYRFI